MSGGGTLVFGDVLKEKLQSELGDFVVIKKSEKAVRKNVDGLAKLIYHNDKGREDIDVFVAVDICCSSVKSKILDKEGNEIIKGIDIPSKVAAPVQLLSFNVRKTKPLADLHLKISSKYGGIGEGDYFVGQLA